MPAVINPLITDAGLAAAISASGTGLQLAITHVALGAGQYNPAAAQTAMTDRREKVAIAAGVVSGTGSFRLSVLFPSFSGAAYNACEIGFYAGDPDAGGVLFAVYSASSGLIVSRTAIDYVASFAMQLTRVPSGSVTVTVDVNLSQAMAQLSAHVGEANPHGQYVRHDAAQGLSTAAKNMGRRNLNAEPGGNYTLATLTRNLTIDNAGMVAIDASAGSLSLNLPAASAMVGTSFRFIRTDTNFGATVTINRSGGDLLMWSGATAQASSVLLPGDCREVVSNGSNAWLSASASEDGVSVGDVIFVPMTTPRVGTIKANGTLLSRALYQRLFQRISSTIGFVSEAAYFAGSSGMYSVGDGATNFRIPDYRGEFIRCWDDGRGVDAGRNMWAQQGHETASHGHASSASTAGDHAHNAYANAVAGHAHNAYANAVGDHAHSGTANSVGDHTHGVYDPGHNHQYTAAAYTTPQSGSSTQVLTGTVTADTTSSGTGITINGAGTHGHNLSINGAGSHGHGISMDAAGSHGHGISMDGAGAHSHSVSVSNTGGAETRPRNVVLLACIKY